MSGESHTGRCADKCHNQGKLECPQASARLSAANPPAAVFAAADSNLAVVAPALPLLQIISNTTASDAALVAAAGQATPGRPSFLVTYFHSSHECYGVAAESKETFKCRRPVSSIKGSTACSLRTMGPAVGKATLACGAK